MTEAMNASVSSHVARIEQAPDGPTGAAITPEALNTELRKCRSVSTRPVTVGLAGRYRHVTAGTSERSLPDVSGRLGSQPDGS